MGHKNGRIIRGRLFPCRLLDPRQGADSSFRQKRVVILDLTRPPPLRIYLVCLRPIGDPGGQGWSSQPVLLLCVTGVEFGEELCAKIPLHGWDSTPGSHRELRLTFPPINQTSSSQLMWLFFCVMQIGTTFIWSDLESLRRDAVFYGIILVIVFGILALIWRKIPDRPTKTI